MGKKHRQCGWPEAKKLCRLNQNDIEMAKRLGFAPGSLVRLIPSPQQKWKLPVKLWIHDLYLQRFGSLIGEKPIVSEPLTLEETEEAARRFEEELYWEDYAARNRDDKPSAFQASHSATHPRGESRIASPAATELDEIFIPRTLDDDLPF